MLVRVCRPLVRVSPASGSYSQKLPADQPHHAGTATAALEGGTTMHHAFEQLRARRRTYGLFGVF